MLDKKTTLIYSICFAATVFCAGYMFHVRPEDTELDGVPYLAPALSGTWREESTGRTWNLNNDGTGSMPGREFNWSIDRDSHFYIGGTMGQADESGSYFVEAPGKSLGRFRVTWNYGKGVSEFVRVR